MLQIGALVVLFALIPYTLFAGYRIYLAVSSWTAGSAGPLVYAMARFVGCFLLIMHFGGFGKRAYACARAIRRVNEVPYESFLSNATESVTTKASVELFPDALHALDGYFNERDDALAQGFEIGRAHV